MSSMAQRATMLDAAMGKQMHPDVVKAYVAEEVSRNPGMKARLEAWCQRSGVANGQPIRVRSDYKYSRVGITFDAAGALQGQDPVDLYSVGIGGVDPVLGTLTQQDTNMVQAGRQDSAELFKAHAHGFTIELVQAGAAFTLEAAVQALTYFNQFGHCIFKNGTQTEQEFPPFKNLPGINTGYQNAGAGPDNVAIAATQGQQSLVRLKPAVYLGAGESFRLQVRFKRTVGNPGVDILPANPELAGSIFAIQHVFYGESYTGISG